MKTRKLGRSGIEVSSIGLGCWAIGGRLDYVANGERHPLSYGDVNDEESRSAIRKAIDLGINFFDTADAYGSGHSEELLGQTLSDYRDDVIISTKFGNLMDYDAKIWLGHPEKMTREIILNDFNASLKRLNTEYIDLYFFHWADYSGDIDVILSALEELVDNGKIRAYGWSTGDSNKASEFIKGKHSTAIQYNYNVLERNPKMLELCMANDQASIARGPLAMGLLTGKYSNTAKLADNDVRSKWWNFEKGREADIMNMLGSVRSVLESTGRTLPQSSLAWLLALDDSIVPIPGFKTVKQVEENAAVLEQGPLSQQVMNEIETILEEFSEKLEYID